MMHSEVNVPRPTDCNGGNHSTCELFFLGTGAGVVVLGSQPREFVSIVQSGGWHGLSSPNLAVSSKQYGWGQLSELTGAVIILYFRLNGSISQRCRCELHVSTIGSNYDFVVRKTHDDHCSNVVGSILCCAGRR